MTTLANSNVDGVNVLRIVGNLDHDGVDAINSQFARKLVGGPVVVDLAEVDIICTPGIGMLLAAHREMQRAGGRMIIAAAGTRVSEVLRTCQLDRVLTLVSAESDAIKRAKE
jgi:anti-sigma B factor antagonist